jgi:hypothetical protein
LVFLRVGFENFQPISFSYVYHKTNNLKTFAP